MSAVRSGRSRRRAGAVRHLAVLALLALLGLAGEAGAFSLLAHQAVVDGAWEKEIEPLLKRRFGAADPAALRRARAHAYGGALAADLGYFPFGSRRFSDLVHYVRTGDFAASLVKNARSRDELAFALGHLAHWVTDGVGHPRATNPAVAALFPDLRDEHGPRVTYGDDPAAHVQTEFRFDVLEVKRGGWRRERFRDTIGFEISKPLLERAVRETYGLELEDLFVDVDLAIGTFRFGVRRFLRELTGVAWHLYEDDLEKQTPGLERDAFVFDLPLDEFREAFGDAYEEPTLFSRFVALLLRAVRVLPGVGSFEERLFEPLPPELAARFDEAEESAVRRYRRLVRGIGRRPPRLRNVDLDTGRPTRRGEYALADEAWAEWLHALAAERFRTATEPIGRALLDFYRDLGP